MSTVRANRNGIVIGTPGSATLDQPAIYNCDAVADNVFGQSDDGQNRACNFLSWADLGAYLDWAGLRPITEMEFEKVCRGPEQAKALEFAWGTDASTDANTLHSDGTAQEGVTDAIVLGAGLASHGYAGPQGPLRAGFGGSDTSNRLSIGAAYYGALEMSGNLWEIMVTVDTIGLQFTGNHGNGELDANGNADVQHWPLTNGAGAGHRGGGWNSGIIPGFRDLATSDRFYAGLPPSTRRNSTGGRGGRSGE